MKHGRRPWCVAALVCLCAYPALQCAREAKGPSATERGATEHTDAAEATPGAPETPAGGVEAGASEAGDAEPGADVSARPRRLSGLPVAPARDAGARAPPEYERVKMDESCGLESLPASYVHQTCCNGKPCRGDCVRFKGQQAPVCYCASLVGGCPAPHHCCRMTHCTWADRCLPH